MRNCCIALVLLAVLTGCGRWDVPDISRDHVSLVTTGIVSSIDLKIVTCVSHDLLIGIPSDFVVDYNTKELFQAIPSKRDGRDIFPLLFRFHGQYPKAAESKPDGPRDRIKEVVFDDIRVKTQTDKH